MATSFGLERLREDRARRARMALERTRKGSSGQDWETWAQEVTNLQRLAERMEPTIRAALEDLRRTVSDTTSEVAYASSFMSGEERPHATWSFSRHQVTADDSSSWVERREEYLYAKVELSLYRHDGNRRPRLKVEGMYGDEERREQLTQTMERLTGLKAD